MTDTPLTLTVLIGSTRPGRLGPVVAAWVNEVAEQGGRFDVRLVDLADLALPIYDEPKHPRLKDYQHDHTKRWAEIVDGSDAMIMVTPEYDFFPPASLVNAVQYLLLEWARKPIGVVSYGGVSGGLRSAQVLRGLLANVGAVALSKSFPIPFVAKQIADGVFEPNDANMDGLSMLLTDLAEWGAGLKPMRG